jgi:hypothetical protein
MCSIYPINTHCVSAMYQVVNMQRLSGHIPLYMKLLIRLRPIDLSFQVRQKDITKHSRKKLCLHTEFKKASQRGQLI